MTATNHALTGAAVAVVVRQPLLVAPVAFASHLLCDAIPHWKLPHVVGHDLKWSYLYLEAGVMLLLATLLLWLGTRAAVVPMVVGALLAMSPDVAWYYYSRRGIRSQSKELDPFTRFHGRIQWSETSWGIVPEILWAGCMIGVILK